MHSFIAYIDESGDDGLKNFRSQTSNGSTQWLSISCVVSRMTNDLEFVGWRDAILKQIPKSNKRDIHFRNLPHGQKLMACQNISKLPLRCISVLSNKTYIPDGIYVRKNQLYHYITRYLIERLSWLCRDLRPNVPEGNGLVKIVFSRRGGMDYDDFQAYLETLKKNQTEIHWPVIDINAVDAMDHSKRAGLQIVDCVASGFRMAVDPDEYGNCEGRYAEALKPVVYKRENNYLSYGLKIVPSIEKMNLTQQQVNFLDYYR